jgi:hypothetical protein
VRSTTTGARWAHATLSALSNYPYPMSFRTFVTRLRALILFAPVLLLTGCSKTTDWGFPEGVSSVNDQSLSLWQGAWIAAGVVGVFTLNRVAQSFRDKLNTTSLLKLPTQLFHSSSLLFFSTSLCKSKK